jgi:hypothetical protein
VRSRDGRTELELLRDTQRSLAEADTIANSTVDRLDGQTEQLHRIEGDSDAISDNLDKSEYLLRGLKPWGWFRNIFRKDPAPPAESIRPVTTTLPKQGAGGYPAGSSSGSSQAPISRGAARMMEEERRRQEQKVGNSGTSAALPPDQQKKIEVNKAYDDIENMLGGLLDKSKAINRTLDQHNQMLPGIDQQMTRNQERINKQRQDMKKIG